MILIRRFVLACMRFNLLVRGAHIPDVLNTLPDLLLPFTDTSISPSSRRHGPKANRSTPTPSADAIDHNMLSLLSASIKPSTKAVYRQAYSNYKHFNTLFYPNLTVFPIDSLRIAKYISFSVIQGNKSSTIQTHIAGLNYFHKILGLKNPCDHFIVKKLLQGSRNLHSSPDKRLPITLTILQGLVDSIESLGLSQYDCFLYRAMF